MRGRSDIISHFQTGDSGADSISNQLLAFRSQCRPFGAFFLNGHMSASSSNHSSSSRPAPAVTRTSPRKLWPMDSQLKDIQPGSGVVIHLEKAWGSVRRCGLRTFRRGYVARMAACRKGDFNPCPHEVLDPRDLKFYRNQGGWYWDLHDDPFAWRDRLPFARVGLAELFLMCGSTKAATLGFAWWANHSTGALKVIAILVAVASAVSCGLIAWFFRNPRRISPPDPGLVGRLRKSGSSCQSSMSISIARRSLDASSVYAIAPASVSTPCALSQPGKTSNWPCSWKKTRLLFAECSCGRSPVL